MSDLNNVILTGRIGQKHLHETQGGSDVVAISLAVSDSYKKENKWVEKTNWIDVVKWTPSETIKGLQKGDSILVKGKLQESEYQKDDGTKIKKIQVNAELIVKIGSSKKTEENTPF